MITLSNTFAYSVMIWYSVQIYASTTAVHHLQHAVKSHFRIIIMNILKLFLKRMFLRKVQISL